MIQLSADPPVRLYPAVLTADECTQLVAMADPLFRPVTVTDGATGISRESPWRTGSMAWLRDPGCCLVHDVRVRVCDLLQLELRRQEELHVVRYQVGQEYRPHYDWFDPAVEGMRLRHLGRGGQRTDSAILYLEVPRHGGETHFPKLGLTVTPAPGALLWFRNVHPDGAIDHRTLHAGVAPRIGHKTIGTLWFRERPIR